MKLISRKGLKTFLPFVAVAITAQAGTLKVITFPVVHPVATVTTTAKVATYPVRHPVKTIKAVSPVQPRW